MRGELGQISGDLSTAFSVANGVAAVMKTAIYQRPIAVVEIGDALFRAVLEETNLHHGVIVYPPRPIFSAVF